MKIKLKNGETVEYSNDSGLSNSDFNDKVISHLQQNYPGQFEDYSDDGTPNSAWKDLKRHAANLGLGYGKGTESLIAGATQTMRGSDTQAYKNASAVMDDQRKYGKPISDSVAGKVGEVLGTAAPQVAASMLIPGSQSLWINALRGVAEGALQGSMQGTSTEEGSNTRAHRIELGGAIGGAVPLAVAGGKWALGTEPVKSAMTKVANSLGYNPMANDAISREVSNAVNNRVSGAASEYERKLATDALRANGKPNQVGIDVGGMGDSINAVEGNLDTQLLLKTDPTASTAANVLLKDAGYMTPAEIEAAKAAGEATQRAGNLNTVEGLQNFHNRMVKLGGLEGSPEVINMGKQTINEGINDINRQLADPLTTKALANQLNDARMSLYKILQTDKFRGDVLAPLRNPNKVAGQVWGQGETELGKIPEMVGSPNSAAKLDLLVKSHPELGKVIDNELGSRLSHAGSSSPRELRHIIESTSGLSRLPPEIQARIEEIYTAAAPGTFSDIPGLGFLDRVPRQDMSKGYVKMGNILASVLRGAPTAATQEIK